MKMSDRLKRYEYALSSILSHEDCKGEYSPKECLKAIFAEVKWALDKEKEAV